MSFINKKPIDKKCMYRFLSDNQTIGTEQYYRNKLGDGLPDELYQYLEIKSKPEYTDEDLKKVMESIKEYRDIYEKKLLEEFEERELENKDEEIEIEDIFEITDIENISINYNE